jgi:uncharacterized protein DUF6446
MTGKIIVLAILATSLFGGAAIYYLQVYGFYQPVEQGEVQLVSMASGAPEAISIDNFDGIDAGSSPIRYRACFTTDIPLDLLSEAYVGLDPTTPRNAPPWFDCFDAAAIGAELDVGTARLFLGHKNVEFGVDRMVAITQDGRGYVWHDLNDCGEKAYDGTVVGEECPKRPAGN